MVGRFAPSPTGELHLGNLRTAVVAWLAARSQGGGFLVRMEDLDRNQAAVEIERGQLDDLAALGIDWDGEVVRQSARFELYEAAIGRLAERDLVYECYCTRREIREQIEAAPSAPHGPPGAYPGLCRDLTDAERAERRDAGRPPALRLRTDGSDVAYHELAVASGQREARAGAVDDVVLRRNDGVPAYNLAVVVDDAVQGVTQVVRGDDLAASSPRQVLLQRLLDLPSPEYLHVPLVLGEDGERLSKRHGAVTLGDLRHHGIGAGDVLAWIAESLALAAPGDRVTLDLLVERFDPAAIPPAPIVSKSPGPRRNAN